MTALFEPHFEHSPVLKLLRSDHAAFILSFLYESFKEHGNNQIAEEDLEVILADNLRYAQETTANAPTQDARAYLRQWCGDDCAYLRRFYSEESGCHVYQLTRHSEKALLWMEDLRQGEKRGYSTSESRFTRIMTELRRLDQGTNADPRARIDELLRQRDALDAEINRIRETGSVETISEGTVQDLLHDLEGMLTAFLADFREIEDNFKQQARDLHALYLEQQVSKGDLIEHALDADEILRSRDQGRSYFGFRQLVRSVESREELAQLIDRATSLAREQGIDTLVFDNLLARLFNEVSTVQDAYRGISGQLRRIVEEQSAREARYLRDLLRKICALAHQCRDTPPQEAIFSWEEALRFNNLMEMPFWERPAVSRFGGIEDSPPGDDDWQAELAKIGKPLDLPRFRRRVEDALQHRPQITLREMLELHPLKDGVVELVCYLIVATEREGSLIRAGAREQIDLCRLIQPRYAELDQIIFIRS
ncbi:DUF3375 family protein [Ruficoccus amylovorans]|uniref:DUF3375 family protein n=1 Tax=Ruficoccus amylovorans TaxID=1804625 RepID=A0A842HIF9_9BACT|nr:DUF3375 family protein [Ruficoccus amylovorans]MBC2595940.1 DUF3375 family protein [Ruficoccus amylovorans]